jgi:hypothetical protein
MRLRAMGLSRQRATKGKRALTSESSREERFAESDSRFVTVLRCLDRIAPRRTPAIASKRRARPARQPSRASRSSPKNPPSAGFFVAAIHGSHSLGRCVAT